MHLEPISIVALITTSVCARGGYLSSSDLIATLNHVAGYWVDCEEKISAIISNNEETDKTKIDVS